MLCVCVCVCVCVLADSSESKSLLISLIFHRPALLLKAEYFRATTSSHDTIAQTDPYRGHTQTDSAVELWEAFLW